MDTNDKPPNYYSLLGQGTGLDSFVMAFALTVLIGTLYTILICTAVSLVMYVLHRNDRYLNEDTRGAIIGCSIGVITGVITLWFISLCGIAIAKGSGLL